MVDNFVSQQLEARRSGGGKSTAADEMSIHTVEVCLHCKWNYLLREDILRVQD